MQYIEMAMVAIFVGIVECSDMKTAYQEHGRRLEMFPCGVPQPRVFELNEVISKDMVAEKAAGRMDWIKPQITVLHRCESTGCCKSPNERCMPKAIEDVTLAFGVFGKSAQYFEVKEVNHTACVCA